MKTIPLDQLGETIKGFNVICSDCGIRLGDHWYDHSTNGFTPCSILYETKNKKYKVTWDFIEGWCIEAPPLYSSITQLLAIIR